MSRPLFIYVNTDEAEARPELAAFVDFYLSDEGIAAVSEADYVALDCRGSRRDACDLGRPLISPLPPPAEPGELPLARPGRAHRTI